MYSNFNRDKNWVDRLKEEYTALIKYMTVCKEEDNDWFKIEANKDGTKWWGKVWVILDMVKYEYDIKFEV
jgi:ufm1-conjugating enzyme 1